MKPIVRLLREVMMLIMLVVSTLGITGQVFGQQIKFKRAIDTSSAGVTALPTGVAFYPNGDYLVSFPDEGKLTRYSPTGAPILTFGGKVVLMDNFNTLGVLTLIVMAMRTL